MFYLFFTTDISTTSFAHQYPHLKYSAALLIFLQLAAFFTGILDYFYCDLQSTISWHNWMHICLALYCFFGALAIYDLKSCKLKPNENVVKNPFS
jgi:hypothetical protein